MKVALLKQAWQKKWLRIVSFSVLSLLLLLFLIMVFDYLYFYSRLYPHIRLNQMDMGYVTFEQAEEILDRAPWASEVLYLESEKGETMELSIKESGLSWDKDATMEVLRQKDRGWQGYRARFRYIIKGKPVTVRGILSVDEILFAEAMSDLAAQMRIYPIDAALKADGNSVEVVPEEDGGYLKVRKLRNDIVDSIRENIYEVDIPVGRWPAALKSAFLEEEGLNQVMASFQTDIEGGNPERLHNIKLGAAAVDKIMLAPGEVLSFGQSVGEVSAEKGYREAPVIVGNEIVPGLGGGLCQVSSTLYNAALYANLEIVERHNHSIHISYLPLGRDATIVSGYLDLKFRNNREHYIILGSELEDLKLKFWVYGPPFEEEVEIRTSDYIKVAPPVNYAYTSHLPPGEKELKSPGRPGHYITTWRLVFREEKEIYREKLSRDYYHPTPAVYWKGREN